MKKVVKMKRNLQQRGYHVIRKICKEEYERLCSRLGEIINETDVKLDKSSRKNVFSSEEVEMHNDCSPFARYISWYCVREGSKLVPIKILSVSSILSKLNKEDMKILSETSFDIPGEENKPILYKREGRYNLYYLPWFNIDTDSGEAERAVGLVKGIINRLKDECTEVHLSSGDALVLDDGRFIHGRDEIDDESKRCLRRFWIKNDKF